MQPKLSSIARVHAPASVLEFNEDSCQHCKASYGHYIICPQINRNVAEAISASHGELSAADAVRVQGLGVKW